MHLFDTGSNSFVYFLCHYLTHFVDHKTLINLVSSKKRQELFQFCKASKKCFFLHFLQSFLNCSELFLPQLLCTVQAAFYFSLSYVVMEE